MSDLGDIAQDFGARSFVVSSRIGIVGVLIQEAVLRVLSGHLDGSLHCTIRALFAWREDHFCAEHLEHLATFDRHAGGHQDLDRVALQARDGGEGDTGVTRRRFENGLARLQTTARLGIVDHRLGDAILHRTERVLTLEFGDQTDPWIGRQSTHIDNGSVADQVENITGHHALGTQGGIHRGHLVS